MALCLALLFAGAVLNFLCRFDSVSVRTGSVFCQLKSLFKEWGDSWSRCLSDGLMEQCFVWGDEVPCFLNSLDDRSFSCL